MASASQDKDLFPPVLLPTLHGRALDALKILAAALMVVDHVDAFILGRENPWLFILGRIVFPLFAYATAAAILRKAHLKKYAIILGIVAFAAQPIYMAATGGYALNVVFTLLLGAFFAYYTAVFSDRVLGILFVIAAALMYFPQLNEFGTAGIVLPAALMLVMQGRPAILPFLLLLLSVINLSSFGDILHAPENDALDSLLDMVFLMAQGLINCALAPYLLIKIAGWLPQNGRLLPKYFLHVFYPLHIIVIWMFK